jgi:predicted regulator of Ras-like GTPase activity (Roadblock/LC7/MglB family)
MDNILAGIKALRGVQAVCFYHDHQVLGSTFPLTQQAAIHSAVPMLEQVFAVLQTIQQDHEEMYIAVGDQQLIAYRLKEGGTVLLLTEKRVNIPLIHMGVKSAGNKLRAVLSTGVAAPQPVAASNPLPSSPVAEEASAGTDLKPILDQLQALLLDYFGPAAGFIFNDALEAWQRQGMPEYQNLGQLLNLLLLEFDSGQEKYDFQRRAEAVISAGKLTPTR